MSDRTDEVVAAYRMIKTQPNTGTSRIGFVGFSQAGWAIPAATVEASPAFTVLVGVAVNWQDQGAYYTRTRLAREGLNPEAVAALVTKNATDDDVLFSGDSIPNGMSAGRFGFIARNRHVDASADVAAMTGPVLAIWGADDLNVDPIVNPATYRQLLPNPETQLVTVIPDATHGLLRASMFNYQLTSQWSPVAAIAFASMGRRAYAPTVIKTMSTWIHRTE